MLNPQQILNYWFGDLDPNGLPSETKRQAWWKKDPDKDAYLTKNHAADIIAANQGEFDHWTETANGRLALIILLDQFSRNIHRDNEGAFANDALALKLTLEGIALNHDLDLPPIYRVFMYMPLEHAEDIEMQTLSLQKFNHLCEITEDETQKLFAGFYQYAVAHKEIIERFGRYPHRNELLGRESTAEEKEFLTQPGSSF